MGGAALVRRRAASAQLSPGVQPTARAAALAWPMTPRLIVSRASPIRALVCFTAATARPSRSP
jgi:hypothetical protein